MNRVRKGRKGRDEVVGSRRKGNTMEYKLLPISKSCIGLSVDV